MSGSGEQPPRRRPGPPLDKHGNPPPAAPPRRPPLYPRSPPVGPTQQPPSQQPPAQRQAPEPAPAQPQAPRRPPAPPSQPLLQRRGSEPARHRKPEREPVPVRRTTKPGPRSTVVHERPLRARPTERRPQRERVDNAEAPAQQGPRHDAATYTPVYVNQHLARARAAGEWVAVVVAAVLAALCIKAYVVEGYEIPSESMENTLLVHDRVVVNKLAYHYGGVHHGDVIVFHKPPTETNPQIHNLIKRVIGLPGDTLEGRDGAVYLNGEPLGEDYTKPGTLTQDLPLTTVAPGQLFVMGDNRDNSEDSRYLGTIDKKLLIGKAEMRAWPISRIGTL